MRRLLVSLVASILPTIALMQAPAASQTASPAAKVPLGQVAAAGAIVAELARPVDARKAKPGDKIEARVTMDVLARGEIVIPRGSKIIGHVTDARARTKEIPQSMVEIVFDRIVLKSKTEIPLKTTIQAIGASLQASAPSNEAASDLDLARQTELRPAPGPNERKNIAETTYPGSRGPANAEGGSEEPTDSSSPRKPSLGTTSQGVFGMKGMALANTAQGSAISSSTMNVHLDGGTQLVLRTTEPQALSSIRRTGN